MKKYPHVSSRILITFLAAILVSLLQIDKSTSLVAQSLPLTGHENFLISLTNAATLTSKFRNTNPTATVWGEYFGKDAVQAILNQGGAVGIRIYYGTNNIGTPVLVLVGVNSNGQDLKAGPLDESGFPCPPLCDSSKTLSH